MKKSLYTIAILGVMLFPAAFLYAANLGFEENYILPPSKVVQGNAYIVASASFIAGVVTGDLTVGSGDVSLSGTFAKDVLVLGATIEAVANIGDDLKALGGRIIVTKSIGGDVVLVGGYLNILPEANIAGDTFLVGWGISASGDYGKNLYLAGNEIFIDGRIKGNVKIFSAGNVVLGEHAVIDGNLTYSSEKDATVSQSAVVKGKVTHQYSVPAVTASTVKGFVSALFGIAFLVRLIITLTAVLFFVLVFRRVSISMTKKSVSDFWRTVLVGLVINIVAPVAVVLLFVTIVGGIVGVVTLLLYLIMVILAYLYSGVVFAYWCLRTVFKKDFPPVIDWKAALLGVVVLHVISFAPYVGIIVALVFILNAFGGLADLVYRQFFNSRK